MDLTRVTIFCFAASYAAALALEAAALTGRLRGLLDGGRRLIAKGFLAAGLFAHVVFLALRASGQPTPLSSPADWCSLAALALAAVCLAAALAWPRWAVGVFLLPLVLLLLTASVAASDEPFAPERASLFWGQTHGWLLLLATVTVSVGFVSGLMYLTQSWRLKQKLPTKPGLGMPSLEWLERTNSRALAVAAWLVAGGFVSGLVLAALKHRGEAAYSLWTDPVVLTLAAMLAWLLATQALRWAWPGASRGGRVAYLTVAAFVLLVATLASLTVGGSVHGAVEARDAAARGVPQATGGAA